MKTNIEATARPWKCKYCGEKVNLDAEGNTHRDGTVSHEECHDGETIRRENAMDERGSL